MALLDEMLGMESFQLRQKSVAFLLYLSTGQIRERQFNKWRGSRERQQIFRKPIQLFGSRRHTMVILKGKCDYSQSYKQSCGSGSFYRQAKILRKTLILTVLWLLYDFLSLKNDVNVASKSKKQKTYSFSCRPWSVSQRYGSVDPDPYQNVTDLQNWQQGVILAWNCWKSWTEAAVISLSWARQASWKAVTRLPAASSLRPTWN